MTQLVDINEIKLKELQNYISYHKENYCVFDPVYNVGTRDLKFLKNQL